MLFNPDMDKRLADLHTAATSGGALSATFHPAFEHDNTKQPARIWVDIAETGRRLVFDVPTAEAVAGQLKANGLADAAGVILAAIPVA
jgi:hypothetical protein